MTGGDGCVVVTDGGDSCVVVTDGGGCDDDSDRWWWLCSDRWWWL